MDSKWSLNLALRWDAKKAEGTGSGANFIRIKMGKVKWDGVEVEVYDGFSDMSGWQFGDGVGFPWLCARSDGEGVDVVVTDWNLIDGELDSAQLGINLDVLIDNYLETEWHKDELVDSERELVIRALENAINKLKTAPDRIKV